MARSRNFLPLLGFVVCVAAVFSYPTFFVKFPVTRDVPWASWLLFALGLGTAGVGIARAYRRPDRYPGRVAGPILGALSLASLAFFIFMTEIWSRDLPVSSSAPRVGEKAPDFTLAATNGAPVRLSQLGAWSLLIFYRGYW